MARSIESAQPSLGSHFLDGDEREPYIDRPLRLVGVRHEPRARFGPRWVVDAVVLDTGELVSIALADNATRTTMFGTIRDDLSADGADAYAPVVLYRASREGGNSFWTFRSATDADYARFAEPEPTVEPDETAAELLPTVEPKGKR